MLWLSKLTVQTRQGLKMLAEIRSVRISFNFLSAALLLVTGPSGVQFVLA
jgi:hypothetical protein